MRTSKDRLRHAIGFEVISLMLSIPIMSFFFDFGLKDIGVVAVLGSIMATVWSYGFNLAFDKAMLKLRGNTLKTSKIRILHVILFEGGLLLLYLPMVAWYLNISLWQAFVMDASLAAFYLVYTFSYNWAYDKVFPIEYYRAEA